MRTASLVAGIATVAAGLALADGSLAVHMLGHGLVVAVGAPLIVLGRPISIVLRALPPRRARQAVRLLRARPGRLLSAPALVWPAFVGVQLAFHVTPLFEAARGPGLEHEIEHALFLATALLFWNVALAAEPFAGGLAPLARAGLLLAAMPANDAAAVYLMATGRGAAGVAMLASMMTLAVAAVAVAWSGLRAEERRRLRWEAVDALG